LAFLGAALSCNSGSSDSKQPTTVGIGSASNSDTGPGGDDDDDDDDDGPSATTSQATGGSPGDDTAGGAVFDVGAAGQCGGKAAGTYCDGDTTYTCDGNGTTTNTTQCLPGVCIEGTGCADCEAGWFTCKGPRVMACDTVGAVPTWDEVEVCDSAAGLYCDATVGGCSPLAPIGGTEPTGSYHLYSTHPIAQDGFSVVCDVDTYENQIYFVAYDAANQLVVGRYDVTLLDSDGDGELEPHQHPDDPDHPGPVEERVFTLVDSFPVSNPGAVPHTMELHATATTLFYAGPSQITAYDLATGVTSMEAPAPAWLGGQTYPYLAFLGRDDLTGVWYSGNETARRVFQYDPETMTWGYAFQYPVLAGDHMDGLEVVTDPNTGIAYVYVSDMTSNFIGQYRHDPVDGWVQENLFTYSEQNGEVVEGFGYGAFFHFWVGSYTQNSIYEIGGGDTIDFLEPPA